MTTWKMIIKYADGSSENSYYEERSTARTMGKFYRTHCEDGPKKVIATPIVKVANPSR